MSPLTLSLCLVYHARSLLSSRRVAGAGEEGGAEALIREDLSLSFSRGNTTFFLRGRYHEKDVIDLDNAGHLGRLAGQVGKAHHPLFV
jgi:hypothetical protein